eukprot:8397043-Ditylum_brightwellii.AAC.1
MIEVDPEKFAVLDSIIQVELVPALIDANNVPTEFDRLFMLPVKEDSLGILSPMTECGLNRQTSVASTQHLVGAIQQEHEMSLQDHDWTMNKGQWEGRKHNSEIY